MISDDATLMAYTDGELDPLTAKRVERAIAADPALARQVMTHRALRERVATAYPLTDKNDDPLETLVRGAPTPLSAKAEPSVTGVHRWMQAVAMAACLLIGVTVGTQWPRGSVSIGLNGSLVASGALAHALDTQLTANGGGETRMLVSFRAAGGDYCRVFAARAIDGIACRDAQGWQLMRTSTSGGTAATAYREAGSEDAAMMAVAQDMMTGVPLDADQERTAKAHAWQ